MNTGEKTLEWLYREQLKVDEHWSVQAPNGFTWWADKNAQKVEIIGTQVNDAGETAYLISVQTDFLRNLAPTDKTLTAINSILMPYASMAGPVYDEKERTLKLCSLVRVHEDIRPWMSRLLSLACVLQIDEIRRMGHQLAADLGAELAESGHPQNGMRDTPDELADIVDPLIVFSGRQPCKWTHEEFEGVVNKYMQQPPSLLATNGGLGFTVEFVFGKESSLCRAMGDQPHPVYGNGLLFVQSFPVSDRGVNEGIRLALELNDAELTKIPFGYGFGSYCYRDKMIHFTSFLPNAVYGNGLLPNLYFACGGRAQEMSLRFRNTEWTEKTFQEAFTRKMERLKLFGAALRKKPT
jgi:hypothetical protein